MKDDAIAMFLQKFVYYVNNISVVDTLFQASFTRVADAGKPFSKCGKCNRYMKYIDLRPMRLYCFTCEVSYFILQLKFAFKGNI